MQARVLPGSESFVQLRNVCDYPMLNYQEMVFKTFTISTDNCSQTPKNQRNETKLRMRYQIHLINITTHRNLYSKCFFCAPRKFVFITYVVRNVSQIFFGGLGFTIARALPRSTEKRQSCSHRIAVQHMTISNDISQTQRRNTMEHYISWFSEK